MRILIAEDDSILADGLVRSLRQSAYAVDHVKNGVEADTALSVQTFDLLILDLGLPRMSGLEVLRRLRARNSNLPVLILTAADSVDERVKGLDLGADDYMAKPFALNELEARVRALTNSLESTPSLAAQAGYMHYRPALLKKGVELYEVRAMLGSTRGSGQGKSISRHGNYGLHAKLYVFDRKAMFVGSMNFDQRSKRLNTEIGLVIYSAVLARQTAVRFDALIQPDNAYHVELADPGRDSQALLWKTRESGADKTYTVEPARSAWQRFEVKVLSWLPLDKEL